MRKSQVFHFIGIALLISLLASCSPAPQVTTNAPTKNTSPQPPATSFQPTETPLPAETSTPTIAPTAAQSLRAYAFQHGIFIGAAVSAPALNQDKPYAETLAREFSLVTPENAMKFDAVHPAQTNYDFTIADKLVKFAQQNGMAVRGHTLVWHNQLPAWVTDGKFSRDELTAILKDHIMTVVGHYRGQVAVWDVVNEAVADDGSLRHTIWLDTIGPDYIDMAFQWAHEADPDAKLFYNDYSNENMGNKSTAVYKLVQGMVQRGVPINGVAFQMHLDVDSPPPESEVSANMQRLSDLGLEVHITELDVRIKGAATDQKLAQQARVYHDMLQVCLSASNCKAFILWGFTDRYSWIPQFLQGYGSALIFDESYQPKPAYSALVDAFSGK
jgi:endo-1,4-beta-xylanase